MTPRDELDARLLVEARERERGRQFRRVLGIIAIAVVIAAIGMGQRDQPLALLVAGALIVLAIGIAVRR